MTHPAIVAKNLAVISGGASGIGLAAAKALSSRFGMHVAIGDVNQSVEDVAKAVQSDAKDGARVWGAQLDVTSEQSVQAFREQVKSTFSGANITVLMANAGVAGPTKASNKEGWDRVLAVNMYGVINVVQAFLDDIKAHKQPSLVINTGSKQGITTPPMTGPAYNVSKAAVKVFTEQLAWELRNDAATKQIEPKLLIPGYVWSSLTGAGTGKPKPDGAWTAEQTVNFMLQRVEQPGVFYILCPDNDTPRETDVKRMQWNINDIIEDRPALSRWHDEHAQQFNEFLKQ